MSISIFPTVNAALNLTAFILLTLGLIAVKKRDTLTHKKMMIGALIASTLFLISYLTYHYLHGSTAYQKHDWTRPLYFTILLTHTPLAALIVPFIITAVVHAIKGNFEQHTRITKWLLPVWMYVSLTGVIIYLMLYIF